MVDEEAVHINDYREEEEASSAIPLVLCAQKVTRACYNGIERTSQETSPALGKT
jgi:hypothetical protein